MPNFEVGDKVMMQLGQRVGTVVGFGWPENPVATTKEWVWVTWPKGMNLTEDWTESVHKNVLKKANVNKKANGAGGGSRRRRRQRRRGTRRSK